MGLHTHPYVGPVVNNFSESSEGFSGGGSSSLESDNRPSEIRHQKIMGCPIVGRSTSNADSTREASNTESSDI